MPNWCDNTLKVISPDKETMDEFLSKITNKEVLCGDGEDALIDFTLLVPRPADKEDDWYEWSWNNWGTKWAPSDIYILAQSDLEIVFDFLTPWGTADELFSKIATLFPTLDFILTYVENGMCFCGAMRWVGGRHYIDHISDYFWEFMESSEINGSGQEGTIWDYVKDTRLLPMSDSIQDTKENRENSWELRDLIRDVIINDCLQSVMSPMETINKQLQNPTSNPMIALVK